MRKSPIERTEEHIAPIHAQRNRRLSTVDQCKAGLRKIRGVKLTSGGFPRVERAILVLQVQLSRPFTGQSDVIRTVLSPQHDGLDSKRRFRRWENAGS